MKDANISWYVVSQDSVEEIDREYYAGAYSPGNIEMTLNLQVWNNKWGTEKTEDVEDAKLILLFDTLEDSALLGYCQVRVDNGAFQKLTIDNNQGMVYLGRPLSGESNLGSASSTNNYANITIKFGPITHGMKDGLKNLLIDLQYNK